MLDLSDTLSQLPESLTCCSDQNWTLRNSTTLEVTIPKTSAMNSIFDELSKHRIQVQSMRNKTNRLEQLFMEITSQQQETNQE